MKSDITPLEAINAPGPWRHRVVHTNSAQFHLVEAGSGPLIVFLHGFPQYWYAWRRFLPALADAGFRAVAMDLRGYAGSDHSPRGYDPVTLSSDVLGLIGSLGEPNATLVGHGWGGTIAWTAAQRSPTLVSRLAVISSPHPTPLRQGTRTAPQLSAWRYAIGYQWPWLPERDFAADNAARVGWLLRAWSVDPTWLTPDVEEMFRAAFQEGNTAHCAMEYHRWAWRSFLRSDGRRFAAMMRSRAVAQPVLHIHGVQDPTILLSTAKASREYVSGSYFWEPLADVGHWPHEEAPDRVQQSLLSWLERT